jgi:hypothetical protein
MKPHSSVSVRDAVWPGQGSRSVYAGFDVVGGSRSIAASQMGRWTRLLEFWALVPRSWLTGLDLDAGGVGEVVGARVGNCARYANELRGKGRKNVRIRRKEDKKVVAHSPPRETSLLSP